jgi:hypothetical protein
VKAVIKAYEGTESGGWLIMPEKYILQYKKSDEEFSETSVLKLCSPPGRGVCCCDMLILL